MSSGIVMATKLLRTLAIWDDKSSARSPYETNTRRIYVSSEVETFPS